MDEEQANKGGGDVVYHPVTALGHDDDENDDVLLSPSNTIHATDHGDDDDVDIAHDEVESRRDDDLFVVDQGAAASWTNSIQRAIHTNFLPDYCPSIGSSTTEINFVEGPFTVKLIKLVLWTFIMITLMHKIVPHITNDRDRSLKLWHIWVFEGNLIVSDMIVFFVVGRMWRQRGIDHFAFLGWAVLANVYYQSQPYFKWLQHSVSLYEMHCEWPWKLYLFALILVPLIVTILWLHLQRAFRKGVLLIKVTEILLCIIFFVAPLAPSPYFHLHHWYAGWLLGMHCNFDAWWSQAVMAYCWGMYINGIAVYGRDPVLTCEYAYFLSVDNGCPYVDCYLEGIHQISNETNHTLVKPMVTPDWRNCSADSFHP